MKENKFKAWDRQGEFWIDERNVVLCPDGEVLIRPDTDDTEWDSGGPIDIVFFTGLLDKNGDEIYEGDIVKCLNGSCGVFVWNDKNASFKIDAKEPGWRHPIEGFTFIDLEVVGNIYDNPELLK